MSTETELGAAVPTALDERLDEHGAVTEGRLGLLAGIGDLTGERGEVPDDAHAAATAAGRRLDEQRQVGLGRGVGSEVAEDRNSRGLHQLLGLDLRAHLLDRLG